MKKIRFKSMLLVVATFICGADVMTAKQPIVPSWKTPQSQTIKISKGDFNVYVSLNWIGLPVKYNIDKKADRWYYKDVHFLGPVFCKYDGYGISWFLYPDIFDWTETYWPYQKLPSNQETPVYYCDVPTDAYWDAGDNIFHCLTYVSGDIPHEIPSYADVTIGANEELYVMGYWVNVRYDQDSEGIYRLTSRQYEFQSHRVFSSGLPNENAFASFYLPDYLMIPDDSEE